MDKLKAEILPNVNSIGHLIMICNPYDYDMIHGKILRMTGNESMATEAAEWCGCATVGEIYEFPEGTIEIKKAG